MYIVAIQQSFSPVEFFYEDELSDALDIIADQTVGGDIVHASLIDNEAGEHHFYDTSPGAGVERSETTYF
jgi:hypothetical protein